MTADQEAERDGLLIQAADCPIIRAAYASGDQSVIALTEAYHPPKRCAHVKAAQDPA